jgi:hypothetical protein
MSPGLKSSLTIAAGLAMMMVAAFAGLSALYPWAYSISFGPTLTGSWVGKVMPADGGQHIVFIQLSADIGEADDNLAGTVSLCHSRDGSHQFGLSGRTLNRLGTAFKLTSFITERMDGRGVQLGSSDGEWDGRNEIHLNARLRLFQITHGGSIATTARSPEQIALEDTPVAFTLRRGSAPAFTSACQALPR